LKIAGIHVFCQKAFRRTFLEDNVFLFSPSCFHVVEKVRSSSFGFIHGVQKAPLCSVRDALHTATLSPRFLDPFCWEEDREGERES